MVPAPYDSIFGGSSVRLNRVMFDSLPQDVTVQVTTPSGENWYGELTTSELLWKPNDPIASMALGRSKTVKRGGKALLIGVPEDPDDAEYLEEKEGAPVTGTFEHEGSVWSLTGKLTSQDDGTGILTDSGLSLDDFVHQIDPATSKDFLDRIAKSRAAVKRMTKGDS